MKIKPVLETKKQRKARLEVLYSKYQPDADFSNFILLPKEIKTLKIMTRKELPLIDSDKYSCYIESLLHYDLVRATNELEYAADNEPHLKFVASARGCRWLHTHNANTRESRIAFLFSVLSLVVSIIALLK